MRISSIIIFFSFFLLFSCSAPEADFIIEYESNPTIVHLTNISNNYTSSQWEIDGQKVAVGSEIKYGFNSGGYHKIQLSITKGRQTTSIIKEVYIDIPSTVTIEKLTITSIDNSLYWDDYKWNNENEDYSNGPDLCILLTGVSANNVLQNYYDPKNAGLNYSSCNYIDITSQQLPLDYVIDYPNPYPTLRINEIDEIIVAIWDLDQDRNHDQINIHFVNMDEYIITPDDYSSYKSYYPDKIQVYSSNIRYTLYLKWD